MNIKFTTRLRAESIYDTITKMGFRRNNKIEEPKQIDWSGLIQFKRQQQEMLLDVEANKAYEVFTRVLKLLTPEQKDELRKLLGNG